MAAVGIVTAALALIGGIVQGVSSYRQNQAASDQANAEAKRQLMEGFAAERRTRRRNAVLISQGETSAAKVGVSLTEGSPLEMVARNTYELDLEALDQRQAGINQSRAYEAQARGFRSAANTALYAGILGGATSAVGTGYRTGAFSLGSSGPTSVSVPSIAYQQPTIVAPVHAGSP